jgi:hypothetical protein
VPAPALIGELLVERGAAAPREVELAVHERRGPFPPLVVLVISPSPPMAGEGRRL